MEESFYPYRCKHCPCRFKFTADFQKHIRLAHRHPHQSSSHQAGDNVEVSSTSGNQRNGSTTDGRRRLSCQACNSSMDSVKNFEHDGKRIGDPTFKCPFCVKVQITKLDISELPGATIPRSTCTQDFPSTLILTNSDGCKDLRPLSLQDICDLHIDQLLQKKKRKKAKKSKKKKSKKRQQPFCSLSVISKLPPRKSKPPKPSSPVTVVPTHTGHTPSSFLSDHPQQSPSHQQICFVPMIRKKSSKQSVVSPTSSQEFPHVNDDSGSCTSDSTNDSQTVKVSVLINSNPTASTSRLGVPKKKHFDKRGAFSCQYCNFVCCSIRDLQYHTNTHMAVSYPCDVCAKIYRSKQSLMNHKERHHPAQITSWNPNSSPSRDLNFLSASIATINNDNESQLQMNTRKSHNIDNKPAKNHGGKTRMTVGSYQNDIDYDQNSTLSNLSSTSMTGSDNSQSQHDYSSIFFSPQESFGRRGDTDCFLNVNDNATATVLRDTEIEIEGEGKNNTNSFSFTAAVNNFPFYYIDPNCQQHQSQSYCFPSTNNTNIKFTSEQNHQHPWLQHAQGAGGGRA